jgi:1,4-dihydroxy-2-naphthoate octaprenyltransferase
MTQTTKDITLADYKKAWRKMNAKRSKIGFIVNLAAYTVVNSVLTVVNLLYVPQFLWCVFPIIGWGIGLAMHYTFGVRFFDKFMATEEAKAERMAGN